jgi:nuclear GTP-binding protein
MSCSHLDNLEGQAEVVRSKEPRMKTNKVCRILLHTDMSFNYIHQKKAANFYSAANVKNKNRNKSTVLKSLSKGEGRKRR